MFNLNWNSLRVFDKSQNNAFEELICQLARAEKIPRQKQFYRVAPPDGGVEAYWELENGEFYGWQAKFFDNTIGWQQIEKSFLSALQNYPKLSKYYVCTPLDRTASRSKAKGSLEQWNDYVKKWQQEAQKQKRTIQFEYWGSSEIFERLSKPEHEGRRYFWFHQEEFTDQWFRRHLESAKADLGERYTPEIPVNLPINRTFDGLAYDNSFQRQFKPLLDSFLEAYKRAWHNGKIVEIQKEWVEISRIVQECRQCYDRINFQEIGTMRQEEFSILLGHCQSMISSAVNILDNLTEKAKKTSSSKEEEDSRPQRFDGDSYFLRNVGGAARELHDFINSPTVTLANTPYLLVSGEGGIGKSHLLADVAFNRLKKNQYTLLLLGEHFYEKEPWTQIIEEHLSLSCKRDAFLGALSATAESTGSRILIMIDALNEGAGTRVWKKHLAGFIQTLRHYPWLGLVLSVRDTYEEVVVQKRLIEDKNLVRIVHEGFAEHEYDAVKLFCTTYNIRQPDFPLLQPEFRNPLYLKLLCESIKEQGLHELPEGYVGFSGIFDSFINVANKRLSDEYQLLKELKVAQKLVRKFSAYLIENDAYFMPLDDALNLLRNANELQDVSNKSAFLQSLIKTGLFTQNKFWAPDDKVDGVSLVYDRLKDYCIAEYLVEGVEKPSPELSFAEGTKLYEFLLSTEQRSYFYEGVLESLSILLPEKFGKELFELAPYTREYESVATAFLSSLQWRKKESFSQEATNYINDIVIRKHGFGKEFLHQLLFLSSRPAHPFNSDFLHKRLQKDTMADRDAWWSQDIHDIYQHEDHSPIQRLLDWAWSDESKDHISNESIRLAAQTITWFLTSSNRRLRDYATKSLVCLLQNRIETLIKILIAFESIDEPFLTQRLYAAAYGCAVRTKDKALLKQLAEYVFVAVFNTKFVKPDILFRDYARGIIEYALHCGHSFSFEVEKIRPPYKSIMPTRFPTDEDIDKQFDIYDTSFPDYYRISQHRIIASMSRWDIDKFDDHFRYCFRPWKDVNVGEIANLGTEWIFTKYGYDVNKHGEFDRDIERWGYRQSKGGIERIGKKYQWIVLHELLAIVSDNHDFYDDNDIWDDKASPSTYAGPWMPMVRDIDPTILTRPNSHTAEADEWWVTTEYTSWDMNNDKWIVATDNILQPECFLSVRDKEANEWLALERHLAWYEESPIGEDRDSSSRKHIWYQLRAYFVPMKDYDRIVEWAKQQNFMGLWMPDSTDRYEMFSREYHWSPAFETFNNEYYGGNEWNGIYENERRRLFAETKDGKNTSNSTLEEEFIRTSIDDATEETIIHNIEIDDNWKHKQSPPPQFIGDALIPVIQYHWEGESSEEMRTRHYIPTKTLFDGLNLRYAEKDGKWENEHGKIVCFDPSCEYDTSPCLFILKSELMKFLQDQNLKIFWTILGEKQILKDDPPNSRLCIFSGTAEMIGENVVSSISLYPDTDE